MSSEQPNDGGAPVPGGLPKRRREDDEADGAELTETEGRAFMVSFLQSF